MAIKFKLSFKKQPAPSGLAHVADPYHSHDVKCNGIKMGYIRHTGIRDTEDGWIARFQVKRERTPQDPCPFAWRCVTEVFSTDAAAKNWFIKNWEALTTKGNLYIEE